MKELHGKIAVVTGAGGGIGRALAVLLAQRGCRLAITDVDGPGLDVTRARIEALGQPVTAHVVDVADRAAMAALADEVARVHGLAQIVVNNAGVAAVATFEDMTLEDFERVMDVNFKGVVHGCKLFLPQLCAAGEGHIVNVSSVFGFIGLPTQSAYAASKFAVRGLSESLRAELAGRRIGVTTVHPGPVATNIVARAQVSHPMGDGLIAATTGWFENVAVSPEHAAGLILRGIVRNSPRVLITPHAYGIELGKRLAPELSDRIVAAVARRRRIV